MRKIEKIRERGQVRQKKRIGKKINKRENR